MTGACLWGCTSLQVCRMLKICPTMLEQSGAAEQEARDLTWKAVVVRIEGTPSPDRLCVLCCTSIPKVPCTVISAAAAAAAAAAALSLIWLAGCWLWPCAASAPEDPS